MKIMQVGHMGRDVAAANNFLEFGHEIHAVAEHDNPDLIKSADESGGRFYRVENICNPALISKCVAESGVELLYVNSDEALAAYVISSVGDSSPELLLGQPG